MSTPSTFRQPDARLADEGFADETREAEPKKRQRQAGRHLVRHERQGEEAEQQRHRHAGDDRGNDADIGTAGEKGGAEAAHRAHHHHALDAEIEDARRSATSSPMAASSNGVAAVMMVRRTAIEAFHECYSAGCAAARGLRLNQRNAIEDERVAGEDEEQQDALEHPGDLVGDAERDLRRLAAEIAERQHQAGNERTQAD